MTDTLEDQLQRQIESILSQLLVAPIPGTEYSEAELPNRTDERLDFRRALQLHRLQHEIGGLEPRNSTLLGPASPGPAQHPEMGHPVVLNLAAGVREVQPPHAVHLLPRQPRRNNHRPEWRTRKLEPGGQVLDLRDERRSAYGAAGSA